MTTKDDPFDELIFDYLEGNLDSKERRSFEARLSGDESLQAMVTVWKKAYVSESLPVTTRLEESMIRMKGVSWRLFLNSFLPVAIAFLLSGASYQEIQSVEKSERDSVIVETRSVDETTVEKCLPGSHRNEVKQIYSLAENIIYDRHTEMRAAVPVSEKEFSLLSQVVDANGLADGLKIDSSLPSVKMLKPALPYRKRQLTQKDRRRINRWKRKAEKERFKKEFFLGNKPYVVPLNENF